MRQIPLDIHRVESPSFANFVAGPNAEAASLLAAIGAGEREARFAYLWGDAGTGKTHLLRALEEAGGLLLGPDSSPESFAFDPGRPLWLIDDCERLDAARQEAVFHLYNRVLAVPTSALVAAGAAPPLALALRDDLRTRLGWGLVLQLRPLSDEDKAAALRSAAEERGVAVSPDVIPWMLAHTSRDIRALLRLFDALDRYAFERKRPITLPLLREFDAAREG